MNEFCSVKYSSFDDAVRMIQSIGPQAILAKIDIKHAFRLCPVRKADWPLLCYQWQDKFYVDTRLPFGSRSSPAIFNTFADALAWILICCGGITFLLHYLDDFLICAPNIDICINWMEVFHRIFHDIGVPISSEKTSGPSPILTYLGIEIDCTTQTIRLPHVKYTKLLASLSGWRGRKKCTKKELLSLIGSLSFAAKVVRPGRIFLRRLIHLSTSVGRLHHHISLNKLAQADIEWWLTFLPSWNGIELFQVDTKAEALQLFTDASSLGLGGVFGNKWFSLHWPQSFVTFDINFKEIFAIYTALVLWGPELKNKQITVFCDNLNIVTIWSSGSCRNADIMKVVRALFFCCASLNISLLTEHIPGHNNTDADLLSRLQVTAFFEHHPLAVPNPAIPPAHIWDF